MRKLRIAQIAPIIERVPPKKYGGTERVVHALTEELVKRGHDVTLFATGDSKTSAKLVSVYPRGLRESKLDFMQKINWSFFQILNAYKMQDQFDIIHDHINIMSLPTVQMASTPTVVTIHGAMTSDTRRIYESTDRPYYVSISDAQVKSIPALQSAKTIYNGLDMKSYPFSLKNKGYLLFVGRMCMEKGVHHAIDVANALDLPIIIAAKLEEGYLGYFKEYVEPRLNGENVKWVGEVDEKERNKLMSEALCFLHPVTWPEPFGLTMIESMACGTPVVAFNKGSVPEVIKDGETGFIVNDINEMIEAVGNIDMINRKNCREHALKTFNERRMADEYERLYYRILSEETINDLKRFFPNLSAN